MRNFIIFILIVAGSVYWFKDWVSSGKMDIYIQQHKNPSKTPAVLFYTAEIYSLCQEAKPASHYYRWLIEEYPDYPKIPKARWQLGRCYEELKQKDLAMEQYTILKDSFSATEFGQLGSNRYSQIKY